jgi:predicted metalloprotease with PDZ domain
LTVQYKVFGDWLDGTYLAIDSTHVHMNMPAAIMWARGLDDRPATLVFTQPPGERWQVATQLHAASLSPASPGSSGSPGPLEFTAPNLQYLMDSPAEFGAFAERQFVVDGHRFRFALHHQGTDAELETFVGNVEKIVRQEEAVYGEFPAYEPGYYTFIADYLPTADEDGMEHRNSTVMTASTSLRNGSPELLDTVAHEFFHSWNVERIRPRSLEPFDLERTNISGELWLAEGFTEYFGPLTLRRAGLSTLAGFCTRMQGFITDVALSPAHLVRSAEDMSRMAAFTDGGRPIDRTNFSTTVTSYYPFGGAIALALDLTLRGRDGGRVTLDDYMRAMWVAYGKPGGQREGYVDRPYTITDAEAKLAEVSGDRAFARDFFARYIQGQEVADYAPLLAQAGLVLRKQFPGRASWGNIQLDARSGAVRIAAPTPPGSPAYALGLDLGDAIREIDGSRVATVTDVSGLIDRHKPGERATVMFVDRAGAAKTATITLIEDPRLELVANASPTPAQQAFRTRWLGN